MEKVWPVCNTERPVGWKEVWGRVLVAIGREVGETSGADPQKP